MSPKLFKKLADRAAKREAKSDRAAKARKRRGPTVPGQLIALKTRFRQLEESFADVSRWFEVLDGRLRDLEYDCGSNHLRLERAEAKLNIPKPKRERR